MKGHVLQASKEQIFPSFFTLFKLHWFPTKLLYTYRSSLNGCKEIEFGIAPHNSCYLTRVVMAQKFITICFLTQTLMRVGIEIVLLFRSVDYNCTPSWPYSSLCMNLFHTVCEFVPFQCTVLMHVNQFHEFFSIQQDRFSEIGIPANGRIS